MEKLLWVPMGGRWCGNGANRKSGGIVMESVGYGRAKKTASKEAGKWGTNLEERAGVRTNSVLTEFERMFPSGLDAMGMPMPTHPAILRLRPTIAAAKLVGNLGDLPGLLVHLLWSVMGVVQQRGQYGFGDYLPMTTTEICLMALHPSRWKRC